MSTSFNFGGIPLRPDVEKLIKAFPRLGPGNTLSHKEIERVLEVIDHKSSRYRAITNSWRKRMFREHALQIAAERNQGFRVLTAEEATSAAVLGITHFGRATFRLSTRVDAIDVNELSKQSQLTHQITRRHAHLLTDMARTARREIALASPQPTRPLPRPA